MEAAVEMYMGLVKETFDGFSTARDPEDRDEHGLPLEP